MISTSPQQLTWSNRQTQNEDHPPFTLVFTTQATQKAAAQAQLLHHRPCEAEVLGLHVPVQRPSAPVQEVHRLQPSERASPPERGARS